MQQRSRISVVGVALLCLGVGTVALSACGQRGPLMAPDAKPSKSVAHQQASAARAASAASAATPAAPAASRTAP